MTKFTAKITHIEDEQTRVVIDYSIYNNGKEIMTKTINLEGDNIDLQIIKNHMRKQLKRLDGVFSKKQGILDYLNKEFEIDIKTNKLKESMIINLKKV